MPRPRERQMSFTHLCYMVLQGVIPQQNYSSSRLHQLWLLVKATVTFHQVHPSNLRTHTGAHAYITHSQELQTLGKICQMRHYKNASLWSKGGDPDNNQKTECTSFERQHHSWYRLYFFGHYFVSVLLFCWNRSVLGISSHLGFNKKDMHVGDAEPVCWLSSALCLAGCIDSEQVVLNILLQRISHGISSDYRFPPQSKVYDKTSHLTDA